MRNHRPKYSALPESAKRKARCRSYTNVLVRRGVIRRQPCAACGAEAQAHHPDYSDPRLVIWLCQEHHRAEHAAARA